MCEQLGVNPFLRALGSYFHLSADVGLSLNVVEMSLNAKEIILWQN
jgi:hypothetical protein